MYTPKQMSKYVVEAFLFCGVGCVCVIQLRVLHSFPALVVTGNKLEIQNIPRLKSFNRKEVDWKLTPIIR